MKTHMGSDELSQFGVLEERIESFISVVRSLKEGKGFLEKKLQTQQEMIEALTNEIERLKVDRESVRKTIGNLLEKIEGSNL